MVAREKRFVPVLAKPKRSRRRDRIRFVVTLGRMLHLYGVPSHRLEAALANVSRQLELDGQFFSTPTSVFATFGETGVQHSTLIRLDPGDQDLEKLVRVDEVADRVVAGELSARRAMRQLEEIVAAPPRYGPLLTTACFGVTSAAASRIFGGDSAEMLASLVVGLEMGLLAITVQHRPSLARLFEPLAAMTAASLAALAALVLGPLSVQIITLSSLIVLVPGLTLTLAISELAARNLISGTARLTGAAVVFLMIAFGVAVGSRLGELLPATTVTWAFAPLPGWTDWAALAVAPLTIAVLFRARPREMIWIVPAAWLGVLGARAGAELLGPGLGAFGGAALLGLAGNLYARVARRPAVVLLVPGILLLVPGSVGFLSVSSLLESDVISGIDTAFAAALVAVSLVAGMLFANAALPSRRSL